MSVYETSITNPKKQLEFYKQLSEQLQQNNEKFKERIEYLERSNNRREDTILEQIKEISDLEDKIDKAIEFLYKIKFDKTDKYICISEYIEYQQLLDILKEVSE